MLKLKNLKVQTQFSCQFLYITFEIDNTYEKVTDYQFDIYRSLASNGEFEVVSTDVMDFNFKDYTVELYNSAIKYYYKIKITNRKTKEFEYSEIIPVNDPIPDNYGFAINAINNLYLDRVIKGTMLLLKRKRFGTYCSCYDDIRESSSEQNSCLKCYGTGFLGGYFHPIEIQVNTYNSPSKGERFEPVSVSEEDRMIQLWTGNFPPLQVGDILVDSSNIRYRIMSWEGTGKGPYFLRQIVQTQKIPETSIEYKIPIIGGE